MDVLFGAVSGSLALPPGSARMMLTGQVFAIMSGTATNADIPAICDSADRWLSAEKPLLFRFHETKI